MFLLTRQKRKMINGISSEAILTFSINHKGFGIKSTKLGLFSNEFINVNKFIRIMRS